MAVALSMVLLREEAAAPAARIAQELQTRYPDLSAANPADKESIASLQLRDGDVFVALMPAPIPWSDLEGPCETSLLWKNAAAEVKPHSAHLIVSVLTELGELERQILLTKITVAVLAANDAALGVYWGSATLLAPKDFFVEYAEKILPLGPPLDIWVDFRVGWQTNTTSGGFTKGMEALGHMELEARDWPEKPSELHERFRELARYLVQNGPVIKDRDTIGQDQTEKIRAVYAPSTFGQNTRVMQLRYESAPAKPWWKIW
jgi:hypothetical protein